MGGCVSHSFPLYNTSCHNLALIDWLYFGFGLGRWRFLSSAVAKPWDAKSWMEKRTAYDPEILDFALDTGTGLDLCFLSSEGMHAKKNERDVRWPRGELWARLVMFISIHVLSSLTIHQSYVSHLPLHLGMTLWTSAHEKWYVSFLRKGPWNTFPVLSFFLHQPAEWSKH